MPRNEIDTKVRLTVGKTIHQGWERVEVSRSLYSLSGTFDLSLSPVWNSMPDDYALYAGEECQVTIGNIPVITGFIDRVRQSIDSSTRRIQVEGRDKTGDLVDCSYMGVLRCWQNISFESLTAKLLGEYNIKYRITTTSGNLYPTWGIQEESIFDNLSKAASLRRLLLTTNGLGELIVTQPKISEISAFINEKSGILVASQCEDFSSRFSFYETRIQNFQAMKISESNLKVIALAKDGAVKRHRPVLIQQDGEIKEDIAQKRINWERDLRVSRSNRVEVTLTSWINHMGKLWEYNQTVNISLPLIGVSGKYLITGVRFSLDSSGMKTCLECEGIHSADIDPTLESREYNLKRVVEEERRHP